MNSSLKIKHKLNNSNRQQSFHPYYSRSVQLRTSSITSLRDSQVLAYSTNPFERRLVNPSQMMSNPSKDRNQPNKAQIPLRMVFSRTINGCTKEVDGQFGTDMYFSKRSPLSQKTSNPRCPMGSSISQIERKPMFLKENSDTFEPWACDNRMYSFNKENISPKRKEEEEVEDEDFVVVEEDDIEKFDYSPPLISNEVLSDRLDAGKTRQMFNFTNSWKNRCMGEERRKRRQRQRKNDYMTSADFLVPFNNYASSVSSASTDDNENFSVNVRFDFSPTSETESPSEESSEPNKYNTMLNALQMFSLYDHPTTSRANLISSTLSSSSSTANLISSPSTAKLILSPSTSNMMSRHHPTTYRTNLISSSSSTTNLISSTLPLSTANLISTSSTAPLISSSSASSTTANLINSPPSLPTANKISSSLLVAKERSKLPMSFSDYSQDDNLEGSGKRWFNAEARAIQKPRECLSPFRESTCFDSQQENATAFSQFISEVIGDEQHENVDVCVVGERRGRGSLIGRRPIRGRRFEYEEEMAIGSSGAERKNERKSEKYQRKPILTYPTEE